MTRPAIGEPAAVPASSVPAASQRSARYWRAVILASRGDGSRRRRASDAVGLGLAVLVAVIATVLVAVNSRAELDVDRFLAPPPDGVRWLVTAVFVLGFAGIVALVVFVAVTSRDLALARDAGAAALLAWLACVAAGVLAGSSGGRPAGSAPHGTSPGYPSVVLAVAVALVVAAYPYLSRSLRRLGLATAALLALAAVVHGTALPNNAVASLAIGYIAGAGVRLIFGVPNGLPSVADISDALTDLAVDSHDVTVATGQDWGVAAFTARDSDGRVLEISVYGRDAADAQLLAKAWRGLLYRDSGTGLFLTRLQQVEHEAYLTLRAGQAGVGAPELAAAGEGGPNGDALLVTVRPAGRPLGSFGQAALPAASIGNLFTTLGRLRAAGLAHGAISGSTVLVDDSGEVALRDFRYASSAAPARRADADVANALVVAALAVGTGDAAAAAARHLEPAVLNGALLHLQPAALTAETARQIKGRKGFLDELRRRSADVAGIDLPELAKLQRISWGSLFLAAGTVIGGWALLGVFVNVGQSFSTLKGAAWGWVAVVAVLSLLPPLILAWSRVASLFRGFPLLQVTLLQESQAFTGLIGSALASMAVTARFCQRHGRDITFATSTSVLDSAASWVVKGALFLIALPLAWGSFHFSSPSGGKHANLINLILYIVVGVGVALGLVIGLPKIRRLAWSKIKPQLVKALVPIRELAAEPRQLAALLAGNAGSQLATALALGAAVHAFDHRLSLACLIVVITLAAMLGGASPVPGGIGVVEAGMIAGFIAAGLPEDVATATVFVQRLFTAYLPPLWGWACLMQLRRRELI